MNKLFYSLFTVLLMTGLMSCITESIHSDSIKIVNNSNEDIVVFYGRESYYESLLIGGPREGNLTNREYRDFLRERCITAHSSKQLDDLRTYIKETFISDTLYMSVFNLMDYDTLSREEFKIIYPIKHEYKITLQYMLNQDWTIIYPPIVQ